ncbi:MAG: MoaD/ThiS family protein [Candidatus Wallbacteria bacterium]
MKLKLLIFLDRIDFLEKLEGITRTGKNEFTLECPPEKIRIDGTGAPSVQGLLKYLHIPIELDLTFVIVNKKIIFKDIILNDNDEVEFLPSISGG